ncbi:MAG: LacI family DNA-binding transcriptional regulator [Ruminococcus sp.]|nr:LacI family DNA-binding transcriptional regulator [Ruminococcus sp.]
MKGKNGGRPLIGIVISEPDFSFYTKALYHIQKELFSQGADAAVFNMLMTYADQMDVEYSVLSLVNTEQVDGLIVFGNTLMLSN